MRSIVLRIDIRGAPRAKYFPSGAIIALNEKQVKMTHVYRSALTTIDGFKSQTASIKGPVDIPGKRINTKIPFLANHSELERSDMFTPINTKLQNQQANNYKVEESKICLFRLSLIYIC